MTGTRIALTIAAASLATGCLGNTYSIPKRDLTALSQTAPAERGEQVRVIQRFSSADRPPEASPVRAGATVVIVAPGPRPRPRRVGSRGGGGKGGSSGLAKAAKEDSKFWIVLAVIGAVGLAATEGMRFDGWARLHPMHPVHLFGPYGEYVSMPLAHVDPQTAAWAKKAIVVETEGPFEPLERAPLNRVGFNYSVLLGTAEQPSADGTEDLGFMSHIQFGYFPAQQVGLLFDIGLGFRDIESTGDTILDGRYSLEAQFLPVSLGIFHGGVFGQLGMGVRLEDGIEDGNRQGLLFGGGAMVQLELTTRLAITARAQATRFYGVTVSDLTVGLSIY